VGGLTHASMRKFAGTMTPCQSKATAMRLIRSPPAATNVATTSTATRMRSAIGSRNARRGIGVPALSVLAARSARSTWARHSATAYESFAGAAISSSIAVAGRWGKPELRSSRRNPSVRVGNRSIKNWAKAAAASRKKAPRPIRRPIAGSHSQRPSQDAARNRPMTVPSEASAGHNLSQRMVQRARSSARASMSRPERPCGGTWGGGAAPGNRSVKYSSNQENPDNHAS